MNVRIGSVALLIVLSATAACGDDAPTDGAASPTTAPETTPVATPTTATPDTTSTVAATSAPGTTVVVDAQAGLEQPAIWPAPDVVFDTPQAAAEDFVAEVLGVPPELGPFQQGDARSGEIEVFSLGEKDAGPSVLRSVLLLRQLGPADGWFVLGAANDNAAISSPSPSAEVAAGPLTVEGVGRGFEANVVVSAFVAGDAGAELDVEITQGGSAETPEPFTVTLDLSGATPGQTVTLLVRGGVGLETDPGDFGAIPVVIAPGS